MRALMGVIKDRHGTYCVQQKVPERLQAAVAKVLGNGKARQVYLKKSLGTKVLREANVRAKQVLAGFDRTLYEAAQLVTQQAKPPAKRSSLNAAEIGRMAEALYGKLLADDEAFRFGGRPFIAKKADWVRKNVDPQFVLPYPLEAVREFGWTPDQLQRQKTHLAHELEAMREALAHGDITAVEDDVALLLDSFQIDLDRASDAYRDLGAQALRAYVRALEDIEKRNAGHPVATPVFVLGDAATNTTGGTVDDALDGWKKERPRPEGTVQEYVRAIELFNQLHGNMPLVQIKRSHAREYREALQAVPRIRAGTLRDASLPELAAWGKKHPHAAKVSAATVNKQLGAVQAIIGWGHLNGVVPDDAAGSNPFDKMRVEEEGSERAPFLVAELQRVFDTPLFTLQDVPKGARGPAGIWLPLLALFTGARQGELAGLKANNIVPGDDETPLMQVVADLKIGRRLKTKSSERVVPLHPEIVRLGFMAYVEARRQSDGADAWLFPLVSPEAPGGGVRAWSKWFGRFLRDEAHIADADKVFHSFRHGFKDALRVATSDEELRDAILGHRGNASVGRDYGSKYMLQRFGLAKLKDAVFNVSYPGLDLSRVQTQAVQRTRDAK